MQAEGLVNGVRVVPVTPGAGSGNAIAPAPLYPVE